MWEGAFMERMKGREREGEGGKDERYKVQGTKRQGRDRYLDSEGSQFASHSPSILVRKYGSPQVTT